MCLKFVIILAVLGVTFCQDVEDYEDYLEENSRREIRQYNQDAWRPAALSQQGNADWTPKDDSQESTDLQLKRRRLRKRKRRPPVFEDTDVYPERPLRRRVRPQRLDEIREPWEEMEEDAISKPNVRRRVTPVYQTSEEDIDKKGDAVGDNRENAPVETVVIVETEEASVQPQMNSISDLKKLLKQTGDISLSELLQQKNLSLSELLNGSEKAISALTERPQQVTQPVETSAPTVFKTNHNYKRLPPSIALRKTTDRNYEAEGESAESLSVKETMDAQRKRLALLGSKENKLYSNIVKFDVVTEATTERRIFVPAHPKYYTSVIFKPDFLPDQQAAPTEKPTTTSSTSTTTALPSTSAAFEGVETTAKTLPALVNKGYLPTTNAKLKLTTKVDEKERENYPFSFKFPKPSKISPSKIIPSKISINEIFGFNGAGEDAGEDAVEDAGEPLRMPIDIETSLKNNMDQFSTVTEAPGANVTLVTAREEIMEIMKDPSARDSLSRILESRNMTVEELVEQRERGSSQLHLADIFHNNTREPEPKDEPFIGQINPEYFNGFKTYARKQKSVNFGGKGIETNRIFTVAKPVEPTTVKMEIVTVKTTEVLPAAEEETAGNSLSFPWKQLYPDLFSDPLESEHQDSRETLIDEDDRRLEDIKSGYVSSVNERYNDTDDDESFLNIPSGVKSALFVSLAIIGLSLFVFIAILVVLRCLQKKTRASNYCSSLSSKMILQGRSTAALKTFMNETLGRKKNYFRSSMQSMSDEIWDSSRDRKPSF